MSDKVAALLRGIALFESGEIDRYIDAHPNESPQEVMAHFGIPWNAEVYRGVIAKSPDLVQELETSPDPHDRAWLVRPS